MSAEFKAAAAAEIEEFKAELRQRFPGRDVDELTDEDLLREVMNTVGKPGKLGEDVRCVVSVSMLTEGWDANTVTHILGVRAFGTQLLCEQVVGRGLRRRSYVVGDDGRFEPEYAEVYGVPFSFIPASGVRRRPQARPDPDPGPGAIEDRIACEITFPRLVGYRWEIPDEHLEADFIDESRLALDSRDVPTRTDVAAVVGETEEHRLDRFEAMRAQEVAFVLAKRLLDRYFRAARRRRPARRRAPWLFPQLVEITKRVDRRVRHAQGRRLHRAARHGPARRRRRREALPRRSCATRAASAGSSRCCARTTPIGLDRATSTSTPPRTSYVTDPDAATSATSSATAAGRPTSPASSSTCRAVRSLREEPGPRLHDPLHDRRPAARATCPTSSSASTTATATTTCST